MTGSRFIPRGPDTLAGASFIALAPNHPLTVALAAGNPDLAAFCAQCKKTATTEAAMEKAEKQGFDTGVDGGQPRWGCAARLGGKLCADGLRDGGRLWLPRP